MEAVDVTQTTWDCETVFCHADGCNARAPGYTLSPWQPFWDTFEYVLAYFAWLLVLLLLLCCYGGVYIYIEVVKKRKESKASHRERRGSRHGEKSPLLRNVA